MLKKTYFLKILFKGWWRMHHFVSCVVGGVLLVWPDGPTYRYQEGGRAMGAKPPGFVKSMIFR